MSSGSWHHDFQLGIRAYYAGEIEVGRRACERLRWRTDLPDHIREQVRRNQSFYAHVLRELVPGLALRAIDLTVPPGWSRFNPSIAADDDGYRMIVRSSNYTVDERMGFAITDGGRVIRTANYLLSLDAHCDVRSDAPIADDTESSGRFAFPVQGFEDCRLFRYRQAWHAVAVTREHNPAGICQIALLRLCGGTFRNLCLLSDASSGRHEKNWVPLPTEDGLFFIYSFRPMILLRYNGTDRTIDRVGAVPGPIIGASFRGGSQAIALGDGYLLVVHESIDFEDGGRVYLHRFVRLDRRFGITHLSPQFSFLDRSVEFCAGLAIRGAKLVASFGHRDREAYLATMPLDEVVAALQPVSGVHGDADGRAHPGTAAFAAPAGARSAGGGQPVSAMPAPGNEGRHRPASRSPRRLKCVSLTLTGSDEALIGDALRSVLDWVDACLVIDTGVTDDSLAIARAVAGDKYVERSFAWVEDFAAARNFALDAAVALGAEWAVIVDTDERLDLRDEPIDTILEQATEDVVAVMHESGIYSKDRFFRLPARGRFVGAVHEYYTAGAGERILPAARFSEVAKDPEGYRRKFERDAAILGRYTASYPDDARWFYYLGDALHNLGRYDEAIDAYQTCAGLKGWDEEAAWACYRAAECWIALGDPDRAIASCGAGLARHPGIAELPWLAAFACWRAERPAHAVAWSYLSIALGNFRGHGGALQRRGFRNPHALYEGPYDVLRFALRAVGDHAGADEAERLHRHAAAAREADS